MRDFKLSLQTAILYFKDDNDKKNICTWVQINTCGMNEKFISFIKLFDGLGNKFMCNWTYTSVWIFIFSTFVEIDQKVAIS